MMTPDQIHASQRAQVGQWFDMADKSLDEVEKLLELNFNACRQTLEDMAHCCENACEVRDMPGAFNWQSGLFKPFAERSAEYGARLMGLASGSGREFSRSFENQWQALTQQMNGWVGGLPRPGEQGPQAAFDYLRNSMKAFDSVWKSARENLTQSHQAALRAVPIQKSPAKTHHKTR